MTPVIWRAMSPVFAVHAVQRIKGFTGRYGRAYLVSGEPALARKPSPTDTLLNTMMQKPVPRRLVTGAHTVGDINCSICGNVLGWKYIAAEEESQRYKVGKFILETERVILSSCWESPAFVESAILPAYSGFTEAGHGQPSNSIEFDSQNEDECEDLFSGIWTPGLALLRPTKLHETMFDGNMTQRPTSELRKGKVG
ncbi:hypothetical protein AbraIFM66950_003029 [Aspergillus brasiliensis]|nr:hypothetical protein AbraIFM66950_003029 [Aspergillus brasiliensis]